MSCPPLPFGLRGPVAFSGSRSLAPQFSLLVSASVSSVLSSGAPVLVGCASGADAAALASLAGSRAASGGAGSRSRCFAAFGADGAGSAGSVSAVGLVRAFAASGGSVVWWAGGGSAVPLVARLASRSRAMVACAGSLVVFFGSGPSRGSALTARLAASRGLPVVAFPCGCGSAGLPSLGSGSWVPVAPCAFPWGGYFVWRLSQNSLF